jgi:hypothetical protein
VIIECPYCRAAHSKPEREAVSGAVMACRRCFKEFAIGAPAGVVPGAATPDATMPGADRSASAKVPVSEFHRASTDVMKVPPAVQREARAKLAQLNSTEETKPGENVLVVAPETTKPDGQSERAPDPPPAAAAEASSAPTSVSTVSEIRRMLDRVKSNRGAMAVEEPVNEQAPMPASAAGPDATPGPSAVGEAILATNMAAEALVSGTGLFFDEQPPGSKRPGPMQATERARQTPEKVAGWPQFPLQALTSYVGGIATFVTTRRRGLKIGILAGSGAVVLLVAIGIVTLLMPAAPNIQFVDDRQVLMAGPGPEEAFAKVGELQRGESVLVFDSGRFAAFVLVRDFLGRVGYISSDALTQYRPLSRAGVAFVACRASSIERDAEPCRARAQAQFDSCREVCGDDADEAKCVEQCQRQLGVCIEGCEANVAPAPAPTPAAPVFDAAPGEARGDPTAESDKGAPKKPAKPPKKPKKPKRR